METEVLKTVGQIAGSGGLALGGFLLLFREIIRKQIFPMLAKKDAYRLLRLISFLIFFVAILGIGAWVFTESQSGIVLGDSISGDSNAINTGEISAANINVNCEPADAN